MLVLVHETIPKLVQFTSCFLLSQGQLQWREVALPASRLRVALRNDSTFSDYIFAVARNQRLHSNGLVWSQCTFNVRYSKCRTLVDSTRNDRPALICLSDTTAHRVTGAPAPDVVNVTSAGPEAISVAWDPITCAHNRGLVLHYVILYCVVPEPGFNCSGDETVCPGTQIRVVCTFLQKHHTKLQHVQTSDLSFRLIWTVCTGSCSKETNQSFCLAFFVRVDS